jgi:rod shape-determining protein MreC
MRIQFREAPIKPLFLQQPSPTLRVVIFAIVSIVLMTLDHRYRYFDLLRARLAFMLSPIEYLVDAPVTAAQWVSTSLQERGRLLSENASLREQNLMLQARLQRFDDLQNENNRLRLLLGSSVKISKRMLVAEVMAIDLDPFNRRMVINKGQSHGVEAGLPLLDAQGVLGQIAHVSAYSSTVILITDPAHALPVQVARTGLRTLAEGTGADNFLALLYLPNNVELQIGDIVVTSGLGGTFPAGYPVGTVAEIKADDDESYTQALVKPYSLLDRNRELVLIWPETPAPPPTDPPAEPTATTPAQTP